jgi:Animal haem peroxidase/Catalase
MSEHTIDQQTPTATDQRTPVALWRERYSGGSAEAEYEEFQQLARAVMEVQMITRNRVSCHGVPHPIQRTFHAKATLAVPDAELHIHDDLPADLRAGFVQPGARYAVTVRYSNASGSGAADFEPDLRGMALRIAVDDSTAVDLLATNFPVSHARNARQFVEFAKATAGGARVGAILRLAGKFGPFEALRMVRNVQTARKQQVSSVATQTYWSRGALTWGPELAVRYLLRPAADTPPGPEPSTTDPNYLSTEAANRLVHNDIRVELCVQRYVNDRVTPIEDTAVQWKEKDSAAEPVATLTIKSTDITSAEAQAHAEAIDQLAFNPWNSTKDFRPLGNLNRARKSAYDASAAQRGQTRWITESPKRNKIFGAIAEKSFPVINRAVPWYRLPVRLALLNLDAFRGVLRTRNLIDTEPHEAPPQTRHVPPAIPEQARVARTCDGTYNDLSAPTMGAIGATFGRNLRAEYRPESFDEPNPLVVADTLLTREHFVPAGFLNILAAAWIQFQVHDWVNHARNPLGVNDIEVPLPAGKTWASTVGGRLEPIMRIAGNQAVGRGVDGGDLFGNATTHWWDGSEVYGTDPAKMAILREGPKLRLTEDGYLPTDLSGMELTGFNESWWLGLSAMHTLFAREHNAVCDELRAHYPGWSDDRVFNTARLVVSALIAKIHTVEWTPAILATEAIDQGLHSNWNGPPSDWITKLGIWLIDAHANVGIPATTPDHHGVPYSLTEDFVTVYRMHPLIPDDYRFVDHRTGQLLHTRQFGEITMGQADSELRSLGLASTLYSLGTAHPGAITLDNYPRALRSFERDGEHIDLAVVDLVRTRRRGVPRYNDFRTGLHKPRLRHWEQLSDDPDVVRRLREVYRSIDDVDTMIGLYAEAPPEGFGFSDTAFRIFILMASRRIQSDRFLTVDFRPEIYSPVGMDWVQENDMTSVILRHCPDVAALLPRGLTAFAPWRCATPPEATR